MKKFIGNISLFIFLFIIINGVVDFFLPENKFWGNLEYSKKITDFRQDNYNTVFFGSSRVLTGINPHQFDSLVNRNSDVKMKSFNLATPGTWANETFYLYDHFLKDTSVSKNVRTVFMEFQNIMAINPDKISTHKVIYYQNFDNITFIVNYAIDEIKINIRKTPSSLFYIATYSLALLENFLHVGRITSQERPFDSLAYHGYDDRGFLALMKKAKQRNSMSQQQLNTYTENISRHLSQKKEPGNKAFLTKMEDLIRESKKNNITILFILPPVKLTREMMNVYNALPDENKIEVCNPNVFTELFIQEHWIDETHLSLDGSYYLNQYLANEYQKRNETP